ncbi:hypothetical protein ZYGR_0AG06780 [Zygosaccharomyces rouxii]|uniref:Mitochondrial morphogenesis protein SLD7 n=1 Tax=Zygosaccharomyces rouxii TaxID=4956 RepID=A0A1Q3AAF3_ZYGRO|nr:hypothetical protein ZYGR_0AG06780 [Zygosaccharomyces rouxii]
MLEQNAVLKFTLGEKYDDIIVKDVQLWSQEPSKIDGIKQLKGRLLQYVDMNKVPLWATIGGTSYVVFTWRSSTASYFTSKLKNENRGIVIDLLNGTNNNDQLLILYRKLKTVQCLKLNLNVKKKFDSQIFSRTVPTTSKEGSIDSIVQQSQRQNQFKAKTIRNHVRTSERKISFNETLSKLILGGLRLRGIPNTQSGFQKLYKITFDAAEFAHRDELKHSDAEVPFETLQETVEVLLKLFCKS